MGIGASRAATVIEALGISSVEDLQRLDLIAFERGAIVQRGELHIAEARLVIGRPYSVITISTQISNPQRERFGIAHELGHLELHRNVDMFPCDTGSLNEWPVMGRASSIEQEANEFAACLLLPENIFGGICDELDPSMEVIKELAEQFGVSIMATARRFVEFCCTPAAIVWTERRQIKWFQRNEAFEDYGFFVNVNSMVEDTTVASRFFDKEYVPKSPEIVRASAWMMEGEYRDLPIREQCISMPRYEGVLSLLWVEDDLIDEFGDHDAEGAY
jgi:Zn-dependent peptidase ImmA (M78 family)